ncbi:unnamed protein product [Lupinus luteus]|uniref:Uncharacterized protein n=1 Tax=Lupinus luteus TaxID=3873 RepID=A0AAV1YBG5_LUPLU
MVLSHLAHGLSAKTVANRYSLHPYLVSKITNMVTHLLATKLYPELIKIPVGRYRLIERTQSFEELTSLPNLCGAIDTMPVKLHSSSSSSSNRIPEMYRAPGGTDDATHFRESLLYNRLTSGDIVWDKNLFDGMLMKGRSVVVDVIGLLRGRTRPVEGWKEPHESGPRPRVLDNEKSFYFFGESLRQALADDLHQKLSSR